MKTLLFGAVIGAIASAPISLYAADAKTADDKPANQTATAPDQTLDSIVVTAQRRQESAQNVGIALTALPGDTLTKRGISNVNQLQYVAPNVEIDPQYGSGNPLFRIRGVGLKDYASNNTATVGVYVDEVAYPFPIQTQGLLFDLARVEILRGPQGTLYGRNSTGGAINFITNRPTREFEGGVTATYGSFNAKTAEGYVSGSFSDNVRGRASFATQEGGAWQHNRLTGEKLGNKDVVALRGQLEFDVSSDLTARLSVHHHQDKSDSNGPRLYQGLIPNATNGAGYATIAPETDPRVTGWSLTPAFAAVTGLAAGSKPHRDNTSDGASLTLNWDFDQLRLTSITSAEDFHRREFIDWDGSIIPQSDEYFDSKINVLSQEVRLASAGNTAFNWLTGLYYSHEKLDEKFYSDFTGYLGYATRTKYTQTADSVALFGQSDYKLTDRLKAVAGVRQEHENRQLDNFTTSYVLYPSNPARVGTSTFPAANRELVTDETSGKLGLEYQLAPASLAYGNIGRGVKSGGFTAYNSTNAHQVDAVQPETLIAYELGLKTDLTDTLRLNTALFYYDYRNQQYQSQVFIDPIIRNIGRLVNIPKSSIQGIELELEWKPIAGLKIDQFAGYKEGKYKEYYGLNVAATKATGYQYAVYSDFSGQELTNFPKISYGGAISYDWTANAIAWSAQADYAFHDKLKSSVPAYDTNSYWLANARLGFHPVGSKWSAALWVRNAFDRKYDLYHGSFLSNAQIANAGLPRTVGVQGSYQF